MSEKEKSDSFTESSSSSVPAWSLTCWPSETSSNWKSEILSVVGREGNLADVELEGSGPGCGGELAGIGLGNWSD